MKIGKLIVEIRRAGGPKLAEEIFDTLTDPEGEARKVIAKMARSAAKDFVQTYGETIIEEVTAELEKRKDAILAELGSAKQAPATPEQCNYCGFSIIESPDGTSCKSGERCPFHGKCIKYLAVPNVPGLPGDTPIIKEKS
jgi:hypothetical protein